jgi:hypothetical protein
VRDFFRQLHRRIREFFNPPKQEVTSPRIAILAAKGIRHPEALTLREIKSICASVLTQAPNRRSK